ncbi:MAG TPA: hypothetical protein VFY29_09970 [Terriglobia bacterium]|nr:hypothetical protein [Terriglobia bacterium]
MNPTMRPNEELLQKIGRVRSQWKRFVWVRGMAWVLAFMLLATFAGIALANSAGVSYGLLTAYKILAPLALLAVVLFAVIRPLRRTPSDIDLARFVEERNPGLKDRLVSAVEVIVKPKPEHGPFGILVVKDALEKTKHVRFGDEIDRTKKRAAWAVTGALAAAFIASLYVALIFLTPFGLNRIIANPLMTPPDADRIQLQVTPGSVTVPKGANVDIKAILTGLNAERAQIHLKFDSSKDWESASMDVVPASDPTYRYQLWNMQEGVEYYVVALGKNSDHFTIRVEDLPKVEKLTYVYHYPGYTGLADKTVDNGLDIDALTGTVVDITATGSKPLKSGRIVFPDGKSIAMSPSGDKLVTGKLPVETNTTFRIELTDNSGRTYLGLDEYRVNARGDGKPIVAFIRPQRDYRATNLEEVFSELRAEDDFGVTSLEIYYKVNGRGEEKKVELFQNQASAPKTISGTYTFFLEEYSLRPGNYISYYGKATDTANPSHSVKTDIYFIEIRPFGFEYRQQNPGEGGGGGGQQQGERGQRGQREDNSPNALTRVQKDIIVATNNMVELKEDPVRFKEQQSQFSDNLHAIGENQSALAERAETLRDRLEARGLSDEDDNFKELSESLTKAVENMNKAAELLGKDQAEKALEAEYEALADLGVVESSFTQIQIEMQAQRGQRGQRGGQQGGQRGQQNAQDLADLFELELDAQRNQYEAAQRGQQNQQQQQTPEEQAAQDRLAQLAQRVQREQQNQQNGRGNSRNAQDLQREAQDMARQLDRLSRENNDQQLQQAAQQLQQAANNLGQQAQNGSQQGQQQASQQVQNAIQQAQQALQNGGQQRGQRGQQAGNQQGGQRGGQNGDPSAQLNQAQGLAERAANQQRAIQNQTAQLAQNPGAPNAQQRVEDINRAQQQVTDTVNNLQQQLRELQTSQNREAATGAREANNTIQQGQLQARANYARQMLEAGLNNQSDGNQAAAAARMNDAVQQERTIQQSLDDAARRLGQAAQAAQAANGNNRQIQQTQEALNQTGQLIDRLNSTALRARNQQQAQGQRGEGQDGQNQQGQQGQGGQEGQRAGQGGQRGEGQQARGQNGQGGQRGQNGERGAGQEGRGQGGQQQAQGGQEGQRGAGQEGRGQGGQRGEGQQGQGGQGGQRGEGQQARGQNGQGGQRGEGQQGQQGQGGQGGQGGQRGEGQQARGGQGGQRGQEGQEGQQGENGQGGQGGGQRGQQQAGNRGGPGGGGQLAGVIQEGQIFGGDATRPGDIRQVQAEANQTIRDLEALRGQLQNNPALARQVDEALSRARALAGRPAGDPAELERLAQSIIDPLRSVELELSKKLDILTGQDQVRTAQEEEIPAELKSVIGSYLKTLGETAKK